MARKAQQPPLILFEEDIRIRHRREAQGALLFDVYFDPITGAVLKRVEVKETDVTNAPPLKKRGRPPGNRPSYLKWYKTNVLDIVMEARLSSAETVVLFRASAFLEFETGYLIHPVKKHRISVTELAELIHIARSNLHSSLTSLAEKGYVLVEKARHGNEIRLNPHVCGFGDDTGVEDFKGAAYKPILSVEERVK